MAKKKKEKGFGLLSLIIVVVLVLASVAIYNYFDRDGDTRVDNDVAAEDTEGRYLTIINATEQVINNVHIYVGEGTELEHGYQLNPDETSFSIEIKDAYDEYDTFIVELIDRYELKYQKKVDNVKLKGRTEVKITEGDYIKQKGDWKKKLDKLVNGD